MHGMLTHSPQTVFFPLHQQLADETAASRGFIAQEPHVQRFINLSKEETAKYLLKRILQTKIVQD